MRTGTGLFLLGILTVVQFRQLPALGPVCLLALPAILSLRFRQLRPAAWYICGFFWAWLVSGTLLQRQFSPELEGVQSVIHGHVSSMPSTFDYSMQFDFQVDKLYDGQGKRQNSPGKIRLNWYRPYPAITAGQRLVLEVRLKRPHGYMNPHGFDYEAWLYQQRIRATGYVRRNITGTNTEQRRFSIHAFRQTVRDRMDQVGQGTASDALLLALTIGDQSRISKQQRQVLAATGTGHLLSISGLHIGLIAAFGFFLTRWLWPVWPGAVNLLPVPRMACLVALLVALVYAALAGFTVPVQRSLIMIVVFVLPGISNRQTSAADSYALALLAVLVYDPLAVLSTSFWLSFGAVLIIMLVPVTLTPGTNFPLLRRWLRMQTYIFIGLISILAVWFNQVPLTGLLANMIAIPWVSFVTVPLVLCGAVLLILYEPLGSLLLKASGKSLDLLWPVLEYLAELDQLMITISEPSIFALGTALAGTALLLLPAGMPARWLGLFWCLPLFFPRVDIAAHAEFETVILDVGQGLAVVVRTRNHLLLYDTGPGFTSGFNTGWAVIVPYLRSTGINKIDLIIQSHADSDHIGGLVDVLDTIQVRAVLSSVPDKIDFDSVKSCERGQKWVWDGVTFEILSPDRNSRLAGNNASCVLKAGNGRNSVLIPGDIERQTELLMLEQIDSPVNSAILIAPHHGSATSSTTGFIRSVRPEHVIFSAGFLNRYRLPKQDIIDRYTQAGAKTLNTADTGAISIQFGKKGYSIVTERERSSRYWNFGK